MKKKRSAGLLMYRRSGTRLEVLLVHPGGPFWMGKDLGAWSIPKGEYEESEDTLEAAKREFEEETGFSYTGPFLPLGAQRQTGGKVVTAWAFAGDCDPTRLVSNTFQMEWPAKSGKTPSFPEVDAAAWFEIGAARARIHKGQVRFLDELELKLGLVPPR